MALTRIDSTGYAGAVWVDAERVAAARRVRSADPRAHAQLLVDGTWVQIYGFAVEDVLELLEIDVWEWVDDE